MVSFVNSNIPQEISSKIRPFIQEFKKISQSVLQSKKLNLLLIPIFRNHNQFTGIDSSTLHLVFTTEGVTSAAVSINEKDLRKEGPFNKNDIIQACVTQLGYKDIHYFGFPIELLDQSSEDRKNKLEEIINQYIQSKIEPTIQLNKLGLSESTTYLNNAKQRFDTKTPEGFADCKTNCRNSLISCITALTGQENVHEGIKILGKKKLFGERETELIDALANLSSKIYNIASKKGPHPPLSSDEEDALLVLKLTQSILDYIAIKALKNKEN